jgi:hypothetical protein
MTTTFTSKVTGEVLMLRADAEKVLAAMGLSTATKGIIEPAVMPAALARIELAMTREESSQPRADTVAHGGDLSNTDEAAVSLRQRAWPLLEMMKRAQAEAEPVVWGV